MVVILDPETPGGLRLSMDCRTESSSATADDIVRRLLRYQIWDPSRLPSRALQFLVLCYFSPGKMRCLSVRNRRDSSDGHYNPGACLRVSCGGGGSDDNTDLESERSCCCVQKSL